MDFIIQLYRVNIYQYSGTHSYISHISLSYSTQIPLEIIYKLPYILIGNDEILEQSKS